MASGLTRFLALWVSLAWFGRLSYATETYIIALERKANVPVIEVSDVAAAATAVKEKAGPLGFGQYYIKLSLGTPAQTYNAIFDTGSGIMLAPCKGYSKGRYKGPLIDPSSATKPNLCSAPSCRTICGANYPSAGCSTQSNCAAYKCTCSAGSKCMFEMLYGDNSNAKGPIYTDSFKFPDSNMPATQMVWGCATDFSATMFDKAAPLFVGMSYQTASLYSQLKSAGLIDDVFGFCLGDGNNQEGFVTTSSPGLLVLGSATVTSQMQAVYKTHLIPKDWKGGPRPFPPGLWVEMTNLQFGNGGNNLLASVYKATLAMMLDTGTSSIVLPKALYKKLFAALKAISLSAGAVNVDDSSGLVDVSFAKPLSAAQLDAMYPMLYFTLGPAGEAVKVPLLPSTYLQRANTNRKSFRFNLQSTDDTVGILGNSFMVNIWIQAKQSTGEVTMGVVSNCDSLTFDEAPFSRRSVISDGGWNNTL